MLLQTLRSPLTMTTAADSSNAAEASLSGQGAATILCHAMLCHAVLCCFAVPIACPAGTARSAQGLNCEKCRLGSFSVEGADVCSLCPEGTTTLSTGADSVDKCGRWQGAMGVQERVVIRESIWLAWFGIRHQELSLSACHHSSRIVLQRCVQTRGHAVGECHVAHIIDDLCTTVLTLSANKVQC